LGALYLSIAASIWGGMFVVVKMAVREVLPIELVWCRYLVAILCLGGYVCCKKVDWHFKRQTLLLILSIGLIGNGLSIVTQETGTMLASAQLGAVITASTPVFMLLFARIILKEPLSVGKIVSILLATLGVIVVVGVHLVGSQLIRGVVYLSIAALTWALMSVLVKKVPAHYSAEQITLLAIIVAFLALTPFIVKNSQIMRTIPWSSPTVFLSILYLGGFSTAFAFVLWNKGLKLLNTGSAGLFFLFQPIVGTLLSNFLLGEALTLNFLIGGVIIGVSIWVAIFIR
jgi:drug/metabolite transporter (DMT)-like permease